MTTTDVRKHNCIRSYCESVFNKIYYKKPHGAVNHRVSITARSIEMYVYLSL